MPKVRRVSAMLGVSLWLSTVALGQLQSPITPRDGPTSPVTKPLLSASVDPKQFGTQDHSIKVVSAVEFKGDCRWLDVASLSEYCCYLDVCPNGAHHYAPFTLPAGAVIDYIGVNTATTVDAAMGFTLHFRDHLGGTAQLVSFSFPAHGFATDYAGPLGILIPNNVDREFVLDVETAPGLEEFQYFGYVEIWWRRVVSDPPATPSFGDVPAAHAFYQFVEALAASGVTGGCGNGNYCPDAPLTRGQMAVFLSKALGLHWPE